ncbi:hypothetical protein AN642_01990 [Epulopiscium sp. SCG-B10WGA-EpuloA2]|nr:hypothetical protein AN642_01990 [Epulopiscium sp. SCG-B10WGA-EpuloA2]
MFNVSDFTKDLYTPKEASLMIGVHAKTISAYCNQGMLEEVRSSGNHRRITKSSLIKYLDNKGLIYYAKKRNDIVYARVSTHNQEKRGDLERQINTILAFCATQNPVNIEIYKEIGSGLNDNRKQLLKIIDMVLADKIDRIFINYKDRLTRFGFNYIETICKFHNTKIIVVSSDVTEKSLEEELEEELAKDLCSIINSFSGKLYRMREKVKKYIDKELE